MPYFIIGGQPVFLSLQRIGQISDEALKDWSPEERVRAFIGGSKKAMEAERLMYEVLKTKHDSDPGRFYAEWVRFNITGNEAPPNTWSLLHDYCCYYGSASLMDLRDTATRIIEDYMGDTYAYPMGKVFALSFFVPLRRRWWKFFRKTRRQEVRILIDTGEISGLVGDLTDFVVHGKNFVLHCHKQGVDILPPAHYDGTNRYIETEAGEVLSLSGCS